MTSTPTPTAALERLFTAPAIQADWFAPSFLQAVPLAQIEQILQDIRNNSGAYQSLQPFESGYRVQFERGKVSAQIALDENGRITGLLLQPQAEAISPEQAIAQLSTFPGQTNLLIMEGDRTLANHNADQPLGVGSTFKLAILAALREQINAGTHTWDEVIALQPQDKSLPSGFLQTWFDGALLTLQSLATLMISQSDNTATDTLLRVVGRSAAEAQTPRNQPLLSTREFFQLKAPQNQGFLDRYRAGNPDQRRQVLAELAAQPLPDAASLFPEGKPYALDVEYWFTPHELCSLMAKVADLPLMSVNPGGGLVKPEQWTRVSFKGGSEPGVVNLTTWLESPQGKTYCVSATWNNPDTALDEARFFQLYGNLIEGLPR
jgi:beta-lactamase class A